MKVLHPITHRLIKQGKQGKGKQDKLKTLSLLESTSFKKVQQTPVLDLLDSKGLAKTNRL